MTALNTNLNENEKKVLDELVKEFNGDFGFTDQISVEGMSKASHGGYIASLQEKGWIWCYTGDPEWKNGFEITAAAAANLGIYSSVEWSGGHG